MKKMMKKAIAFGLTLTMVLGISLTAMAADKKFPDVKAGAWYESSINGLVAKGGIDGESDGNFYPNRSISNAEFIKITVATTLGEEPKGNKHWAENYMTKAAEAKLITSTEFAGKWDEPMSRNNMAKVMAATLEFVLKEEVVPATAYDSYLKNFSDYDKLCESCKPAIANTYALGIVTGNPDKSFGGSNTATRAEACTMLIRLIDKEQRVANKALTPEELAELEKKDGNVIPDDEWQDYEGDDFFNNGDEEIYYTTSSELPLTIYSQKYKVKTTVNSLKVTKTHVIINYTQNGGSGSNLVMKEANGTIRNRSGWLQEKVNVNGDTFDVKYRIAGDSIEVDSSGKTDIKKVKYFMVSLSNRILAIENPSYGGK